MGRLCVGVSGCVAGPFFCIPVFSFLCTVGKFWYKLSTYCCMFGLLKVWVYEVGLDEMNELLSRVSLK